MLASVLTSAVYGLDGRLVKVEADISQNLPKFTIVGLPDTAVQEARERVRAAISNSGVDFPDDRITVSLAPANLPKSGAHYDLPVALAILCASGQIQNLDKDTLFLGELGLDGSLRPVSSVLPMVLTSKLNGLKKVYLPFGNEVEASLVPGVQIFPLKSLSDLVSHLKQGTILEPYTANETPNDSPLEDYPDLGTVRGQELVKRALEVVAAGGHNLFMLGPPGTGKTMLARCLPGILPKLEDKESLEVTTILSITGKLNPKSPKIKTRPFRAPHYTISPVGLVGGGTVPKPGEVTLSNCGVLFMDELPEFGRATLEVLRQPLEDKTVTITRASGTVDYPAKFMLIAAMNPCPCGYYGTQVKECKCPINAINSYKRRVSGPLLDRFDMFVPVPRIEYDDLLKKPAKLESLDVQERVSAARKIQKERLSKFGENKFTNADIGAKEISKVCVLDDEANTILKRAADNMKLSARAIHRLLKVSRTIADLAQEEIISTEHVSEAVNYRFFDQE